MPPTLAVTLCAKTTSTRFLRNAFGIRAIFKPENGIAFDQGPVTGKTVGLRGTLHGRAGAGVGRKVVPPRVAAAHVRAHVRALHRAHVPAAHAGAAP